MKLHVLKIKQNFLYLVLQGQKKAELRKDDRDYKRGDLIHFVNINGKEFEVFENNLFRITDIIRDAQEYGLQDGYAMLSIEEVN